MSSAFPAVAINPPANFSAEAGNQSVKLRWTPSVSVTSYNLEQSFNGGGWVHIADPLATDTGYTRINLWNGTPYSYRINAVGSGSTSTWSTVVSDAFDEPAHRSIGSSGELCGDGTDESDHIDLEFGSLRDAI